VTGTVAPLTPATVVGSWTWDTVSAVLIVLAAAGYGWAYYRGRRSENAVRRSRAVCFGIGVAVWIVATMSMVGVYANVLFWVRALQVLLLLMVIPFFLAIGQPVTVLLVGVGPEGRAALERLLRSRLLRVLAHPATTSLAMLGTPWLFYLTPWYVAALQHQSVKVLTQVLFLMIGFGYFYARLQTDPVPRRYSQLLSVLISVVETIGDGLLGIVLWLGPLVAADYYIGLHRAWGPSLRVDQSIGAGVLWILGDVLGVPFLLVLFRALSADERAHAAVVDAELDQVEDSDDAQDSASTLWWLNDPQLRERFGRR
jgi:cytochrome c oxidase assembly factor CtaG